MDADKVMNEHCGVWQALFHSFAPSIRSDNMHSFALSIEALRQQFSVSSAALGLDMGVDKEVQPSSLGYGARTNHGLLVVASTTHTSYRIVPPNQRIRSDFCLFRLGLNYDWTFIMEGGARRR